jgi:hypothetical protein
MRFARGDMRDHIVSHKNDHGPSHRRYSVGAVEASKNPLAKFSVWFDFRLLQQYLPQSDIVA